MHLKHTLTDVVTTLEITYTFYLCKGAQQHVLLQCGHAGFESDLHSNPDHTTLKSH